MRLQVEPAPVADEAGSLRRAVGLTYELLRERDVDRLRETIARHARELLSASVVRSFQPGADLEWRLVGDAAPLPPLAEEMERELLPRAVAAQKSLISSHPALDASLGDLAERCAAAGLVTHLLLVRARGETHGAYAVHWHRRSRPPYEQRVGFYYYWDTVGIAVAAAKERARIDAELAGLRQRAFVDALTGLPNGHALDEELRRHDATPLGVLALDFDGMREANARFASYAAGGDVLISAVGRGLASLLAPGEFAARMYTAGDEFAVLLPGATEASTQLRAAQIEHALDLLDVPETHRPVYRGASVGFSIRRGDESAGQALGRAIEAMRRRKLERSSER
jgi:diguanylate cyclase (GGDEF)-like protein